MLVYAAVAVVFEKPEAVRREQIDVLQAHIDIVVALDRMGRAAVRSVFGPNNDPIANLLGVRLVPAGAGEAQMARTRFFDLAQAAVFAAQHSRVGTEHLVFEIARGVFYGSLWFARWWR